MVYENKSVTMLGVELTGGVPCVDGRTTVMTMEYDFSSLSDYDFEVLVRDLLSARDGHRYESFKAGRDKGIDLRCLKSGNTIAQCKHWRRTGFAALKRNLEAEEAAKIRQLKPDRYLIVTSVPLSAGNKADLRSAIHPFVKADDDILGQEDLNSLLREFPRVELAHPKLWLTSAAVLDRLVNAGVYARTTRKVEDIQRNACLYVQNRSFSEARRRLSEFHVCVIAGPPGIGKTMLADMLLLHHLSEGYEPVMVSQDASEADEVLKAGSRQIFLYDDFLGRTNLVEHFNKNEDSRLSQLIHHVHTSPAKRLILTTREYILRDAQVQYDVLEEARLDPLKVVIDLSRYTRREKAQIFYNHLYFSDLPLASLREIVDSRLYHKIIGHRNYNPRLIHHVTSMAMRADRGAEQFGEFVINTLENPTELWRKVFSSISRLDQTVLLVLATFRASVQIAALYDSIHAFSCALNADQPDRWSFEQSLKRLEGTFIDIDSDDPGVSEVDFWDPSVRDFILYYIDSEPSELQALVEGAVCFEQLQLLAGYGRASRQDGVPNTLQYEGIASTIRRISPRFADRCLDIIEEDDKGGTLVRRALDARIAACAEMSPQLVSERLDDWITKEMNSRAEAWENESGPRDSVILVAQSVEFLDVRRQAEVSGVLAAAKTVCTVLDDAVSYRNFVTLAERLPILMEADDFQRARQEFRAFADDEIDRLYEVGDADALMEGIENLEYVSGRLGVDISNHLVNLHELLNELAPEDVDQWEEPDREGPSSWEVETAEIDSLFESLIGGAQK
jgi:hypothetical protein